MINTVCAPSSTFCGTLLFSTELLMETTDQFGVRRFNRHNALTIVTLLTLLLAACGTTGLNKFEAARTTDLQNVRVSAPIEPPVRVDNPTTTHAPVDALVVTNSPDPTSTLLAANSTPLPPDQTLATVIRVIDGDTIEVSMDGATYRVRYIGINTPETDQVCGSEATQANAAIVSGQQVRLVKDVSETDQYGRLLRYVYVGDMMVNAQLVADGWAEAATYPPDVRYADHFAQLAAGARASGRGCWSTSVWTAPTEGRVIQRTQLPVAIRAIQASAPAAVCDCSGNLYNCGDFSTHRQAQACYDYCVSVGAGDVHQLDGDDNDGFVCESL